MLIHPTQIGLGTIISLFSSLAVPLDGLGVTLRHATTVLIHPTQTGLGIRIFLLSGLAVPLDRLGVTLRHATTVLIHPTQTGLGIRIFLLSGLAVPENRLSKVFRDSQAIVIGAAQEERRLPVAVVGQPLDLLNDAPRQLLPAFHVLAKSHPAGNVTPCQPHHRQRVPALGRLPKEPASAGVIRLAVCRYI